MILNGKELEQTPLLIVSFGGGHGGYSYHYRYIRVSGIDNGTINATGYSVPPSFLKENNIFAKKDSSLHCFVAVNYSKSSRDQLREILLKGSLVKAKQYALEKNRHTSNPLPEPVIDIPRQAIIACSNWIYNGPDLSKVTEDWTLCQENFHNQPIIDKVSGQPLSFGSLEKAVEHFEDMPENEGIYIVHRTEEIVHNVK